MYLLLIKVETGNFKTITTIDNSMASPYHGMNGEISVMLIDNDKEFVNEMTSCLQAHGYRGTI